MTISLLHEDDDTMVIHKPAGIVVNRAASVKGETIQDWAEKKLHIYNASVSNPEADTQVFVERSGVAHRLDKDTSGCLIIAKNPTALQSLLMQFKSRTIDKEYTALVYGSVTPTDGTIKAPIGRLPWRRGLFGIMPGGKNATTHYHVQGVYEREKRKFSLLNLKIETGRTHQIRVHLQYIHHPIVGDVFYAGRKRTRTDSAWCPRLFLHAAKIGFDHPTSGKRIAVSCKLPDELQLPWIYSQK